MTEPNKLFSEFLDMVEFELHRADEHDAPDPDKGETGRWYITDLQKGWLNISSERFDSAYEIMDRLSHCLQDYVLDDLEREVAAYSLGTEFDSAEEWADFYKRNNSNPAEIVQKFICDHRFDLELCALYNDECKGVDLEQIYNELNPEICRVQTERQGGF